MSRESFPCGLAQPAHGQRFSVDSLLLAGFAARFGRAQAALDLGAGCGVVGLGLLLLEAAAGLTSLERDPAMAACARENAARLGLEADVTVVEGDVRLVRDILDLAPESFDLAAANPPFFAPGAGRTSPHPEKNPARFEEPDTLAAFAFAAAYALKNRSRACFVYAAERLPHLLATLCAAGLEPKELLMVHGRLELPARLTLVAAVKNGRPGLRVEPPLALYADKTGTPTPQALALAPWLAPRRG